MQVIFVFGLIGLVYTVVATLTIALSSSAIQVKQQNYQDIERFFDDIDIAINKSIIHQQFFLSDVDKTDLTFLAPYLSWSQQELLTDPWGGEYRVHHAREYVTVYAEGTCDGTHNCAQVPVDAFAIVSSGPDLVFQTTNLLETATYNDVRTLSAALDEDDVVYTFTTFNAAHTLWQRIAGLSEQVFTLAAKHYTDQVQAFRDQIDIYYIDNPGSYSGTEWMDDLTAQAAYPQMPASLAEIGADELIASIHELVNDFTFTLSGFRGTKPTVVTVALEDITDSWQFRYERTIDGEDLIAGTD